MNQNQILAKGSHAQEQSLLKTLTRQVDLSNQQSQYMNSKTINRRQSILLSSRGLVVPQVKNFKQFSQQIRNSKENRRNSLQDHTSDFQQFKNLKNFNQEHQFMQEQKQMSSSHAVETQNSNQIVEEEEKEGQSPIKIKKFVHSIHKGEIPNHSKNKNKNKNINLDEVMKNEKIQEEKKDEAQYKWQIASKIIPKKINLNQAAENISKEGQIIYLLKKNHRTQQDNEELAKLTAHLDYFKHINSSEFNMKNQLSYKICKSLKFEYFPTGKVIFYKNQVATKFYIVIKGSAMVLIEKEKKQLNRELDELIKQKGSKFDVNLMQKISKVKLFQRFMRKIWILQCFFSVLRDKKRKRKHKNVKESVQKNRQQIALKYDFTYFEKTRNLVKKQTGVDLLYLQNIPKFFYKSVFLYYVGTIYPSGGVFGERGMSVDSKRAATIIANEDCYLASLSKSQFKQLLSDIERQKMEKKIEFLKPIITENKDLSIEKMSKINFIFQPQKFFIGENIIYEGQKLDGFYLIKKGDIEIKRLKMSQHKNQGEGHEVMIKNNHTSKHQDKEPEKVQNKEDLFKKNISSYKGTHNIFYDTFEERIAMLGIGEIFGEECIYDGVLQSSYTATVRSNNVKVYYVSKTYFQNFIQMQENQDISQFLFNKYKLKQQFHEVLSQQKEQMRQYLNKKDNKKPKDQFTIKKSIDEYMNSLNDTKQTLKFKYFQQHEQKFVQNKELQDPNSNIEQKFKKKPTPTFSVRMIESVKTNEKLMEQIQNQAIKKNVRSNLSDYDYYMYMRTFCFSQKELQRLSRKKNAILPQDEPQQQKQQQYSNQNNVRKSIQSNPNSTTQQSQLEAQLQQLIQKTNIENRESINLLLNNYKQELYQDSQQNQKNYNKNQENYQIQEQQTLENEQCETKQTEIFQNNNKQNEEENIQHSHDMGIQTQEGINIDEEMDFFLRNEQNHQNQQQIKIQNIKYANIQEESPKNSQTFKNNKPIQKSSNYFFRKNKKNSSMNDLTSAQSALENIRIESQMGCREKSANNPFLSPQIQTGSFFLNSQVQSSPQKLKKKELEQNQISNNIIKSFQSVNTQSAQNSRKQSQNLGYKTFHSKKNSLQNLNDINYQNKQQQQQSISYKQSINSLKNIINPNSTVEKQQRKQQSLQLTLNHSQESSFNKEQNQQLNQNSTQQNFRSYELNKINSFRNSLNSNRNTNKNNSKLLSQTQQNFKFIKSTQNTLKTPQSRNTLLNNPQSSQSNKSFRSSQNINFSNSNTQNQNIYKGNFYYPKSKKSLQNLIGSNVSIDQPTNYYNQNQKQNELISTTTFQNINTNSEHFLSPFSKKCNEITLKTNQTQSAAHSPKSSISEFQLHSLFQAQKFKGDLQQNVNQTNNQQLNQLDLNINQQQQLQHQQQQQQLQQFQFQQQQIQQQQQLPLLYSPIKQTNYKEPQNQQIIQSEKNDKQLNKKQFFQHINSSLTPGNKVTVLNHMGKPMNFYNFTQKQQQILQQSAQQQQSKSLVNTPNSQQNNVFIKPF